MATINVTYHANTRLMEITQSTSNGVATTGDNNTTRIQFTFDDTGGLLNGYQKRAEFNVLVPADNSSTYKPYIYLDENDGVSLPNTILANVKCGTLPMQLAFTKTVDEEKIELYSLNILNLRINNAINALYPTPSQSYPTVRDAIYDVQYDNSDATFTFTQLDGNTIVVTLSDLREEHFEVETYEDLASLTDAENGDTATVLSTGIWYKLYVGEETGHWYPMAGITELNGTLTLVPSFFAPTTSGTSGQYLESGGNGQPPVWVSKVTSVVQSDAVPTSRAVYIGLEAKLDDSQLITSWGDADSKATDSNIPSARLVKTLLNQHTNSINSINSKIPAQASPSNQLADKNYVNNAIATESADYLGKYNAVTDLHIPQEVVDTYTFDPTEEMATQVATAISTQLSLDPTNNDTVNIIINKSTTTDFDWYWSFKFNDTQNEWKFQFPIGNTAFTPSEWETIDSGLTSEDVTAIRNIGDGTVNIIDSGAGSLGSFTLNQKQDVTITVPDGSTQYINQSATFVLQDVPDYADYPYRASVPITNMTHTMFASVVFSDEQVDSGVYSPMCETYDGGVYVYANADVGTITIPTISAGYDTSLELDSVPTQNSTDAVMSGGVWSAIGSDSRVVHTTGAETVAGAKTLTDTATFKHNDNNIILANPDITLNTIPTVAKWNTMYFKDNGGNELGYIGQSIQPTTGDGFIRFRCYNYNRGYNTIMTLNCTSAGGTYLQAPNRTYNSANTSDVVTIGSLQASTDVVHISGNETIGGTKIFTSNVECSSSDAPYVVKLSALPANRATFGTTTVNPLAVAIRNTANNTAFAGLNFKETTSSREIDLQLYSPANGWKYLKLIDDGSNVYSTTPYRTSNITNDDVLTAGNGVTLSTAQTITGLKTINVTGSLDALRIKNNRIVFQNPDFTINTLPASATMQYISFSDSNDSSIRNLGSMGYGIDTAGNGYIDISARRYTNEGTKHIYLYSNTDGTGYVTVPTRTYSASNTSDVVTIGSLQSSTDVVHTAGNETIGGTKTFTSNPYFEGSPYIKNTSPEIRFNNTNSLVSSDGMAMSLRGYDASHSYAQIDGYRRGASSLSELHMYVRNTSDTTARMAIYEYDNGTAWAVCPSRTYNASNTSDIVTIGSLQASTDVVHTSGNETIDGVKTFNNSIIATGNNLYGFQKINSSLPSGRGSFVASGSYDTAITTLTNSNSSQFFQLSEVDSTSIREIRFRMFSPTANNWRGLSITDNSTAVYATIPFRPYADGSTSTGASDVLTKAHLESAITIGGAKTFTSNITLTKTNPDIIMNNSGIDRTTTPGASTYLGIKNYDVNGKYLNIVGFQRTPTNQATYLGVFRQGSTDVQSVLGVYDDGTSAWATAPIIPTYSSSNTSHIVTIGSLQSSTDVVHTSGNETVAGQKTFTSNPVSSTISGGYTIKGTDQTQTTAPSSNRFLGYEMVGSDGTLLAQYGVASRTNGNREAYIDVVNTDTSVNSIRIYSLANNTGYATLAHVRSYANAGNPDILTKGHLEEAITIGGNKTFSGIVTLNRGTMQIGTEGSVADDGRIEIYGKWPYIDMHYGATGTDYTTRIWNNADGNLRFDIKDTSNNTATMNLSSSGYLQVPSPAPTTSATRNITISDQAPSGGNDGDIWIQYEV